MRFDCGKRRDRKEAQLQAEIARVTDWHRWFAWFPVRVAPNDCRWLEWVEQKFYLYDRLGNLPILIKRIERRAITQDQPND